MKNINCWIRLTILMASLLVLTLSVSAQDNYTDYMNEDGSISFSYPDDWKVTEADENIITVGTIDNIQEVITANQPELTSGQYGVYMRFDDPTVLTVLLYNMSYEAISAANLEEITAALISNTNQGTILTATLPGGTTISYINEYSGNNVNYFTYMPSEFQFVTIYGVSSVEDAPQFESMFFSIVDSLILNAPENACIDVIDASQLVITENTIDELGENGFYATRRDGRTMIISDAEWIALPTPPVNRFVNSERFDFYLFHDACGEISYIGIRGLPVDVQVGTYNIGNNGYIGAGIRTYVDTIYDGGSVSQGKLVIEQVDNNRISGYVDLVSEDAFGSPKNTYATARFTDIEIPSVNECIVTSLEADGEHSFDIYSTPEFLDVDIAEQTGVWVMHGIDTFESFDLPDNTYQLHFNTSTSIDGIVDVTNRDEGQAINAVISIINISSEHLMVGKHQIGTDDMFDKSIPSADVALMLEDRGIYSSALDKTLGTLVITENNGTTISGEYTLRVITLYSFYDTVYDENAEEVVITTINGNFSNILIPSVDCEIRSN